MDRGRRQKLLLAAVAIAWTSGASSQAFDHAHSAWDALLKTHVRRLPDNKLEDVFARSAAQLSAHASVHEQLRARHLTALFLDYDWSLNDLGR
jgi:hypothetical protein